MVLKIMNVNDDNDDDDGTDHCRYVLLPSRS